MPTYFPRLAFHAVIPLLCLLTLAGCGGETPSRARTVAGAPAQAATPALTARAYDSALQQIYVGYFGRPADPGGLLYYGELLLDLKAPTDIKGLWSAYSSNRDVAAVIDSFGNSQESNDLYPGNAGVFITAIYRNLFNREPDAAGKAYWVQLLDQRAITRANAVLSLMAGARDSDIELITKKTTLAGGFTSALTSAATTNAYSGDDANAAVRDALSQVSTASDSQADQARLNGVVAKLAADLALEKQVIFAAGDGALVQKTDGTLWGWGARAPGGVGSNLPIKVTDIAFTKIAADGYAGNFAGLTSNGDLYVWGLGRNGQFGPNLAKTGYSTPTHTGLSGFTSVALGAATLATTITGQLVGWGDGRFGTLLGKTTENNVAPYTMLGGVKSVYQFIDTVYATTHDGSLLTWGRDVLRLGGDGNAILTAPRTVATDVKQVASGANFLLILKNDGTLWGIGDNNLGQLGTGDNLAVRTKPVQVGDNYVAIAAGQHFALGLKANRSIWSWGNNQYGQVGDGTVVDRYQAVKIMDNGAAIAAGTAHALALKLDGSVWAWGHNQQAELGDGRSSNRMKPYQVFHTAPGKCAGGTSAVRNQCQAWDDPDLVCTAPQVKQGGYCVTPPPPPITCTSPAKLINDQCVTPTGCTANQLDVAGICLERACSHPYASMNQCSPAALGYGLRVTMFGPTTAFPPEFGTPMLAYVFFNERIGANIGTIKLTTLSGAQVPSSTKIDYRTDQNGMLKQALHVIPEAELFGEYLVELNGEIGAQVNPAWKIPADMRKLPVLFDPGFTPSPVGDPPSRATLNLAAYNAVTVDFRTTEMMASTLVAGALTLYNVTDDKPVVVTTYVEGNNTLKVAPPGGLLANTTYRATLGTSVKSRKGNHLAQPYSWTFVTPSAPPESTCPLYTSIRGSSCDLGPLTPGGGTPTTPTTPTSPTTPTTPASAGKSVTAITPAAGTSGVECLRWAQGKDAQAWKISNVCATQVYVLTCQAAGSKVPGTSGGICGTQAGKLFYVHTFWLEGGESSENRYSRPYDTDIWYGACKKVGSLQPSATVVDTTGRYRCKA